MDTRPVIPTARGYPLGTAKDILMAKNLGIYDIWTPVLYLQLTANHSLSYTGEKAQSVWKAWQAYVFGGKGKAKAKKG
jgi:hypothetical protein